MGRTAPNAPLHELTVAALPAELLDRLLDGIGAAIDDHGGSFVMSFESVLITAARLHT